MARHASTYRQARREAWKQHNAVAEVEMTWPEANQIIKGGARAVAARFGPVRTEYAGGAHFLGGRSKYMPHIGKKQRAKGAARAA